LLRDAERNLHRHRLLHVEELNKHRLSCLWPEIDCAGLYSLLKLLSKLGAGELLVVNFVQKLIKGIHRPDRGLEHQVELTLI
jgi:hypothetical protein